ncbi:MAG: YidC/Oxa1 family insertase periplasmic-domain containing protein [Pirellulales bacterium]|nr:YidC/Oxa1 family insertase periplasmic-domain containing protein [Pirellulales bacterium]
MEKRLASFMAIAIAILLANALITNWLFPPKPKPAAQKMAEAQAAADAAAKEAAPEPDVDGTDKAAASETSDPATPEAAAETPQVDAEPETPEERITLGSIDEASGYRLLVTLVNRGAAVERIELANPQYLDQEERSGYLGHLAAFDAENQPGAVVGVVGRGTPAEKAGLKAGDIITALGPAKITSGAALEAAMRRTRPGQSLSIGVVREGKEQTLQTELSRPPMEVIRPSNLPELLKTWERSDPDMLRPSWDESRPSFLLTLQQLDDRRLGEAAGELRGLNLEEGTWELVEGASDAQAEFRRAVGDTGLVIVKRYELEKARGAKDPPGYHLTLTVEIRNTSPSARQVAYRLNGPNGLPTEGWWYSSKLNRSGWGGAGPRDVVSGTWEDGSVSSSLTSTAIIVAAEAHEAHRGANVAYLGIDAQFFSAVMLPKKSKPEENWIHQWQPAVIGPIPKESDKTRLANVSFQLTSDTVALEPTASVSHAYTIFAGPKKPDIVAAYGLSDLIYYGWFGQVARPMAGLLHIFYALIRNYGLAIILLTVLVRSAMMPLSRKQAMSAQKMQELQPELKKLQDKYKNDMEARSKAQRELFLKHNYNPLGGCLLMFIQLPIFIGLYRSLSADVALRGAPLLWDGGWCSNLAAPDMLFRWNFLPNFLLGWLGPYFNLLPVITIVLFIWQQKMFMPPPTDEQAAMQQKMMQYMMVFIGVMFFKVPSGLCIYFIASSLWGLAERKLLPKSNAAAAAPVPAVAPTARSSSAPGGNGSGRAGDRKKQRDRR